MVPSPTCPIPRTSRAAFSSTTRASACAPRAWSARLAASIARSRRIIETRWLREQDQLTLHDLAEEFGVSAERIRQIEAQAMKKMRGLIPAA